MKFSSYNPSILLHFQLFLPILLLVLSLTIADKDEKMRKSLQNLNISLADYFNTDVFLQTNGSDFLAQYKNMIEHSQNIVNVSIADDMDKFLLNNEKNYTLNYALGATFTQSKIVGWFNFEYSHAVPLTLNLVNQAILKTLAGSDYSLSVSNHPYLSRKSSLFHGLDSFIVFLLVNVLITAIVMVFSSLYSTSYIKERTSGMKLMQFNFGFSRLTYWMLSLTFDVISFMILNLTVYSMLYVFLIFLHGTSLEFSTLGTLFGMMMFFGFQIISFMNLTSLAFQKSYNFKLFLVLLNTVPGDFFNFNYF